ncbi:MAG TPA: cbb3-type cytochrome c oxidase subunit 3 [Gemmatimonadaceae bacterium]|nr:cbb3-type cytochrome c oxidase subunit 3 [Gemmatimonadaceae bacterium]
MSLKDIMARAGIDLYGEIMLIVAILLFLFLLWRIYAPSRRAEMERMAELPLEDDPAPSPRTGGN